MRIFFLQPGETTLSADGCQNELSDSGYSHVERVIGHVCDLDYYKRSNANLNSNTSPTDDLQAHSGAAASKSSHGRIYDQVPSVSSDHVLVIYHGHAPEEVQSAAAARDRALRDGSFADAVCLQLLHTEDGELDENLAPVGRWWADVLRTKPAKARSPKRAEAEAGGINMFGGAAGGVPERTPDVPAAVGPMVAVGSAGGRSSAPSSAGGSSGRRSKKEGSAGSRRADGADGVENAPAAASGPQREQNPGTTSAERGDGAVEGENAAAENAVAAEEEEGGGEKNEQELGKDDDAEKKSQKSASGSRKSGVSPQQDREHEPSEANKSSPSGIKSKKSSSGSPSTNTKLNKHAASTGNRNPAGMNDVVDGVSDRADIPVASVSTSSITTGKLVPIGDHPLATQQLLDQQGQLLAARHGEEDERRRGRRPRVDGEILSRIGSVVFSVMFVVREPLQRRMIANLIRQPTGLVPTDFGGDSGTLHFLNLRPASLCGLETGAEADMPKWVLLGEKSLLDWKWELFFVLTPDLVY